MAEHTLIAKALDATAFSVRHDARSFAVPSKLAARRSTSAPSGASSPKA